MLADCNSTTNASSLMNVYMPCGDGQCVLDEYWCDGVDHCANAGDELNCPCDDFRCDDGRCIEKSLACNGVANCNDQSDEFNETCGESILIYEA